jgi:hypothetical protein
MSRGSFPPALFQEEDQHRCVIWHEGQTDRQTEVKGLLEECSVQQHSIWGNLKSAPEIIKRDISSFAADFWGGENT